MPDDERELKMRGRDRTEQVSSCKGATRLHIIEENVGVFRVVMKCPGGLLDMR